MGSVEQIRSILQKRPEAANEPFWDHDCERPLCCATRLKCSSSIVQVLVEFGANSESQDVFGHNNAQIARQPQPREVQRSSNTDFPFTWASMSFDQPIHSQIDFGCQPMPVGANEAWKREVAAGWQMPAKPSMPAEPNEAWKREVAAMLEMPAEPNEAWKPYVWEMPAKPDECCKHEVAAEWGMPAEADEAWKREVAVECEM